MGDKKEKEENTDRGTQAGQSKDASTRENNAQIEENTQQGGPKGPSSGGGAGQNTTGA